MNCKLLLPFLLFISEFLFSCNEKASETTKTNVHHFSQADTVFLFPNEYRRKNYKNVEFENNSKWLNVFDEKRMFDGKPDKYIRLGYSRAFDNSIIIRVESNNVVVKQNNILEVNDSSHFDSTLLTEVENGWLRHHDYYRWLVRKHSVDSANTIKRIFSIYPDIDDPNKKWYLLDKGRVYEQDSIVYIENAQGLKKNLLGNLFKKLDSIDFWSYQHVLYKSMSDGSGFILEAKNGSKYNIVNCSNCDAKYLIEIRDELLKFTNLKKDEIY